MEAVYVHIPFCRKICSYCDFPKVLHIDNFVDDYLEALHNEILDNYEGEPIRVLYLGGGTPSCLTRAERTKLFNVLEIFKKTYDCEFTFECNPQDINESLLDDLVLAGINRISIGIESFDPKNLEFLEREADFDDIQAKLELIRARGIDNINLDLMYAIPGETITTLKKDLNKLIKLNPTHISTYSLIIEEHTKLNNMGVKYISEDLDAKMYETIVKELEKNGYHRYELSNFAKEGYESLHNLNYWNNLEYYGFGLGASGYINDTRYTNTRNLHKYIKGEYRATSEVLDMKMAMDNEIMLGLRKAKGLNVNDFYERFGKNIQDEYPRIKDLLKANVLSFKEGYLAIVPEKMYIMNEILIQII